MAERTAKIPSVRCQPRSPAGEGAGCCPPALDPPLGPRVLHAPHTHHLGQEGVANPGALASHGGPYCQEALQPSEVKGGQVDGGGPAPGSRQRARASDQLVGASWPPGRGVGVQCLESYQAWWEAGPHSPSKSSRWPAGRPQSTPVQAARPRLGQPVTHHHRVVTAAERPSGGPLRGRRGQLSALRAQQPEPHTLRGCGEVIATALSTVSRHQVSPKEALFPGAVPA